MKTESVVAAGPLARVPKWSCAVRYLDNPAGPLKGRIDLEQQDKPEHGSTNFGPFGRCVIKTVRKIA